MRNKYHINITKITNITQISDGATNNRPGGGVPNIETWRVEGVVTLPVEVSPLTRPAVAPEKYHKQTSQTSQISQIYQISGEGDTRGW